MSKCPRLALCHLESLVALPALNALFASLGGQIDLVILSNRFGATKHGSIVRQFVEGVRRSGLRMTFWLGFDILSAQVVSRIAQLTGWLLGRPPSLRSVRALAAQCGAVVVECSDVNSPEIVKKLRDAKVDLVVVMNFDQILRSEFIAAPRVGVVNLHPSLLPALRGPCPVFWALVEGHQQVGVTLHIIDSAEIDAGPIVGQCAIAANPRPSVAELTSDLFLKGVRLVERSTMQLVEGQLLPVREQGFKTNYRGFPSRAQMATTAARRVRLSRLAHLAKLMRAAVGLSGGYI